MKLIPFSTNELFNTREIIETVASKPGPRGGIAPEEMRRRCRILDALEAAKDDSLLLEDADHGLLVGLINGFQFGIADRKLLMLIDEIIQAEAPATVEADDAAH